MYASTRKRNVKTIYEYGIYAILSILFFIYIRMAHINNTCCSEISSKIAENSIFTLEFAIFSLTLYILSIEWMILSQIN